MEINNLKNEYLLRGNDTGCLLIHGFSSTPAELRELGERLNSEGYTVLGVRLAGHGTEVDDMEKSTYEDWIKSVETGYEELRVSCSSIYIVGHSMGALLALCIAEKYKADKVALLSPAMVTSDKAAKFVAIIKYFKRYTEWEPVERPEEENKYLLGYSRIPLKSVQELNRLQIFSKKNLSKIDCPILVVHSHKDTAVSERGISIIENGVSSKEIKKTFLNNCGHNITVECEKETVFSEVVGFLKNS